MRPDHADRRRVAARCRLQAEPPPGKPPLIALDAIVPRMWSPAPRPRLSLAAEEQRRPTHSGQPPDAAEEREGATGQP